MCVSLCCITFHPQTQWLKTTTILCTHGSGGREGVSSLVGLIGVVLLFISPRVIWLQLFGSSKWGWVALLTFLGMEAGCRQAVCLQKPVSASLHGSKSSWREGKTTHNPFPVSACVTFAVPLAKASLVAKLWVHVGGDDTGVWIEGGSPGSVGSHYCNCLPTRRK